MTTSPPVRHHDAPPPWRAHPAEAAASLALTWGALMALYLAGAALLVAWRPELADDLLTPARLLAGGAGVAGVMAMMVGGDALAARINRKWVL